MNRKELQSVMLVMVLLIVMLFSAIGYIWFSEVKYPLFGRHADSFREMSELRAEIADYRKINDSLRQELWHSADYWMAAEIPDSIIAPGMETFQNGISKYSLLGTFKLLEDARKAAANAQSLTMFRCKVFKKVGDQLQSIE